MRPTLPNVLMTDSQGYEVETIELTPEKDEIIHYRAVNRWDEDNLFDRSADL